MSRILFLIAVLCGLALAGCQTLSQSSSVSKTHATWKNSDVSSLKKGMTPKQVTAILGQPDGRQTKSGNAMVWEYRKPAVNGPQPSAWHRFASLGQIRETSHRDILKVSFSNGRVKEFSLEENVRPLPFNR